MLGKVMKLLNAKWERKRWGLRVGNAHGPLTNLRFADDLLLVGRSRQQVAKMLQDLLEGSSASGLKIHYGKINEFHNGIGTGARSIAGTIEVAVTDIEVLASQRNQVICFYVIPRSSLTGPSSLAIEAHAVGCYEEPKYT